ncbi:MAG: MBL fold metallo-hydrolase [Pseudomonadota bacterium]|mgnify:FL=1|nr:MBL fold metallo-hydrolase [Pseudomonadota bacterium]|tara:strand:+ start:549 stop:1199 length:651 start_codon:yes stop_codon:yes gene_type:complete
MAMIKAIINPVTPFQQNAPILFCEKSKKCAFVDPGGDIDILLEVAKNNNLIPEKILLTHGHADHAGAANELAQMLSIEIEGPHKEDAFLLDSLELQGKMFGMQAQNCIPNRWLNDGDEVQLGDAILKVLFCPGHTPGHIIFFHPESKLAAVGDVLFRGSIGRTDLPRGNHQELLNSITQKLWPLGEEVLFISGHGPVSTFGQERKDNAFVADSVLS